MTIPTEHQQCQGDHNNSTHTPANIIGGQRDITASLHQAYIRAEYRINISTLLLSRVSKRTRHDLHGIYAKGIRIDLPDAIDGVLRRVETLQPMTPRQILG